MLKKIFVLLTTVLLSLSIMTVNIRADEDDVVLNGDENINETVDNQEENNQDSDPTTVNEDENKDGDKQDDLDNQDVDNSDNQNNEGEDNQNQQDDSQSDDTGSDTNDDDTDNNNKDDLEIIDDLIDEIDPIENEDELEDAEFTADLSEYIIQAGGFSTLEAEGDSIQSVPAAEILNVTYTEAETAILNALKARQASVNLSAYALNDNQFKGAFFKVVNENGDLFYVKTMVGWNRSGGYVSIARFFYYDYSQADIDFFNQAVDSIIAKVDPSWSDLQKAIYLHDWVESNCNYDYSYSRYNAYNVIVDGSAVCQGYALAYSMLCRRAGVQCQVITSDELRHAWNIMKLGGEYFYIDTTWDDGNGVPEHFDFENFLCSRQQFYNIGHDSTDWKLNNVSSAYNNISTSTRYDNAFWKGAKKPLSMYGNYTLYYDSSNYNIVVYDLMRESIYKVYSPQNGNQNEFVSYFHAVADGTSSLFITDGYNIYSFNIHTGAQELLYSLSDQERSSGKIFALGIKNHKVQYKLSNDWGYSYSIKNTLNAETVVRQQSLDNSIKIISDDESLFTYLKKYRSSFKLIVNPGSYNEETFKFTYFDNEDLETRNYYYDVISPFKEDEYAVISYQTLLNRSVPSGNAVIEFDYNNKHFRSSEFYMNACNSAPYVNVYESGNNLIISSSDSSYLEALTAPETLNHVEGYRDVGSFLQLNVDGKEYKVNNLKIIKRSYEKTSDNIFYEGGQIRIPKQALLNCGVVNGENVTASLFVSGYAKNNVPVNGGITLGCAAGQINFNMYQNIDGDIIIESENTEWLRTLETAKVFVGENKEPLLNDYGYISGKYQNFTIGNEEVDLDIELFNERHDDDNKVCYYYDNGRIVIPNDSLVEYNIPGGTYDLVIHVPGYEDNTSDNFIINSIVQAYAPSDLRFYNDYKYGIMAQTYDSDWINALENGKITIYDSNDNKYVFDTPNCFTRHSSSVTYLSPEYLYGAGIVSGNYKVIFEPKNYVSYGVRYVLNINTSVKKMFTVKFFNDENEMIKYVGVKQGGSASAPAKPTKQGYTFDGWLFNGKIYKSVSSVKQNMDMYYGWKENTYKLAFNANGGKGTLEKTKTYSLNDIVTITDIVPEKGGYEFLGWSFDKKATVPEYRVGDTLTRINYDSKNNVTFTLYAVYGTDPITYTMKLNPNGGLLGNKQSYDTRLVYNSSTNLYETSYNVLSLAFRLPTLVKEGYKFNGWYHDVWNLKKQEYVPTKISSVSKGSYGNKVIYALFTPVTYNISYNLNKGSIVKGEVYDRKFNIETSNITLPVPVRKGYIFEGWFIDKLLTTEVRNVDDLPYKNVTLYAKWRAITYRVVFEYENERTDEIELTYDVSQKVSTPVFTSMLGKAPSSYTYYNDVNKLVKFSSLNLKNLTCEENKLVVISCQSFKNITYKVKYVLNGGKNASTNKTSYTVDNPIYLADATKKGYEFQGWYDNSEFLGVPIRELRMGDYTLYACFGMGSFVLSDKYLQTTGRKIVPNKTIQIVLK